MRETAPSPCRYLICCSPRTGSTLLSAGLRATDAAGAPAEPFDPKNVLERGRQDLPGHELVKLTLDETVSPNGVSGAKMMWHHLAPLIAPDHQYSISAAEMAAFARRLAPMRYIWITRRDRAAQAVSFVRALQTNRWVAADPASQVEPRFVWDEVHRYKELLAHYDHQWRKHFEATGIQPFEIVYEDFAEDYVRMMRRVLDFLGLESTDVPEQVTQKQADATSQEWIRRYNAPRLTDYRQTLVRRLHRGLGLTRLRDRWRDSRFA